MTVPSEKKVYLQLAYININVYHLLDGGGSPICVMIYYCAAVQGVEDVPLFAVTSIKEMKY